MRILNLKKKFIFIIVFFSISCSHFNINLTKDEELIAKDLIDNMIINIKVKLNSDRIFINSFNDMIGKKINTIDPRIIVQADLSLLKSTSGSSPTGITTQYSKIINVNYLVKIPRKVLKKESDKIITEIKYYEFEPGFVRSYSQFAGNPADLFSEYVAELYAEDLVARQAARELYYNIVLSIRSHLIRCRNIGQTLKEKIQFVNANDKSMKDDQENKRIEDIDLDNITKSDYKLYESACKFD